MYNFKYISFVTADEETTQIPSPTPSSIEANANGFDDHEEGTEHTEISTSTENIDSSPTSEVHRDETTESAFMTTPAIIDEDEEDLKSRLYTGPALYKPGELPRPRFVMLGQQGVGKVIFWHTDHITNFFKYIWLYYICYKIDSLFLSRP